MSMTLEQELEKIKAKYRPLLDKMNQEHRDIYAKKQELSDKSFKLWQEDKEKHADEIARLDAEKSKLHKEYYELQDKILKVSNTYKANKTKAKNKHERAAAKSESLSEQLLRKF